MTKTKARKKEPRDNQITTPKVATAGSAFEHAVVPKTGRSYAIFSVMLLLASSTVWSFLGATLQLRNADQLVNSYMFQDLATFQSSVFPGSHTFLIKWPLFLLIKLLGTTNAAFIGVTIGLVLATVSSLAFIIYKIESRSYVFGTIMLMLASALLLVSPVPYPGALLPTNMAMIATRNIEYALYIMSLIFLIRAKSIKNKGLWIGLVGLALLVASDKLFATLTIGGALMATMFYVLFRRWTMAKLSFKWLVCGLGAMLFATASLWFIGRVGITNISSQTQSGPYELIKTFKQFALAIVFGVLGLLSNFGANPAFDAQLLRSIPGLVRTRIFDAAGIAYIVNAIIFLIGFYAVIRVWLVTSFAATQKDQKHDTAGALSQLVLWSSIAAAGAFVVTDHYYVVDSRYLAISLFALFIGLATYVRNKRFTYSSLFVMLPITLVCSILLGCFSVAHSYSADKMALADIDQRNLFIADSLQHHHVEVLVGDYWRVVPIRQDNLESTSIMPLDACTQPRSVLTSKNWQSDLTKHSFAYLLSFDKSLTNYPNCTLDQVTALYGRPNASVLIAGKLDKPKELLLFYDHGIHKTEPVSTTAAHVDDTILPVSLNQLPNLHCGGDPTLVNIIAHQDDDLLFMNPDLETAVAAKQCVRTIYLTAGDAGNGPLYWLGREKGSEAAYSTMLGINSLWVQRVVKLNEGQFATFASPRGNPRVTLVFLRLPDGNLSGQGFKNSKYESLASLDAKRIVALHSVDGQSQYSSDSLVSSLKMLLQTYQPNEIHAQAVENMSTRFPDHSDHLAAGHYAKRTIQEYGTPAELKSVKYYIGYPIHARAENVSGELLDLKIKTFLAYTQYDGSTCDTLEHCDNQSVYGQYLRRQYTVAP